MKLPAKGRSEEEVLATLESYRAQGLDVHSGRIFAYSFNPARDVEATTVEAFRRFISDNALDPTTFPALVRMETEIVRMIADLLRGDEDVVGSFTSGGTESILLAVKTARDKARAEHPDINVPEMILPKSAHCAFHKAAQYFDVKPVVVAIDRETLRADAEAIRSAITPQTILVVASAPQFAHGVIDPIEAIAAICHSRSLWLHVDACVGGIQLSLMRRMGGYDIPPFDFSVPGVCSISADMHKYGYSPKGASVLLHRNKSFRRHQIFVSLDSATYGLVNPNVQSTRSGGPMAGAWAALQRLGEDGYVAMIREVMKATAKIIDHVNGTKDLYVLAKPDFCMFAIASETLNVFELADEMKARGWYLQPQFSTEYSPMNVHVSVSFGNVAVIDEFLGAIDDSLKVLRSQPPLDVNMLRGQIDEMARGANSPEDLLAQLGSVAGFSDGQLPERMAFINTALECLPRELGARILGDFVNDLYV